MKNILLVSPDFNPADTKTRYVHFRNSGFFDLPITPAKSFMAPLSLATVSALTPEGFDVDIWDEGVHGPITPETEFEKEYDIVGVTGYVSHTSRIRELGTFFRDKGVLTVAGGPDVSGSPEHYRDFFDILFVNEVEYTWPEFINDWSNDNYRSEYRQVEKPPMSDSPTPRWDKLTPYIRDYSVAAAQTTRGCPFDCTFCDVVYIYGRDPRHKSIEQVVEEIRVLQRSGASVIFLCDDNFIGTPKYTREILEALIELNKEFPRPLAYHTQITLNVTDPQNEDILAMLAEANFTNLFVGVETPNEEALKEANKGHNLHGDIASSIEKIHRYGMVVQPGMIVGFDSDDASIFEKHIEFIQKTGMWNPMENVLKAPLGTKLWVQMHQEGRIVKPRGVDDYEDQIGSDLLTNIIPAQMTREQLMSGYRDMVAEIRDWRNFERRGKTMIEQVTDRPHHLQNSQYSWDEIKKSMPFYARFILSLDSDKTMSRVLIKTLLSILKKCPSRVTAKLFGHGVSQYLSSTNLEKSRAEEQSSAFIPFLFSIDPDAGVAILGLIIYTLKHRPYLLEQVLGQIGRQYMLASQLPDLVKAANEQIKWEQEYGLDKEPTVFFVPEEFKKIYPSIFPNLYERVRSGLQDKPSTLNAMVEVTYDFLTRWGDNFQGLNEQYRLYMHEICDQVISAYNNSMHSNEETKVDADAQLIGLAAGQVGVRLKRWSEDVLHSVEQRMRAQGKELASNF